MINNNKILTVSYGTFSCTLEGFDDSFGTMKAIAEYFRDLASDDRYFGAEPPQPDAEMLARIAEREISRRVEAREHQGRIVLSAGEAEQDAAPAPTPIAATALAAAPLVDEVQAPDVAAAEDVAPPVAEPDAPTEDMAEAAHVPEMEDVTTSETTETVNEEDAVAAADVEVDTQDQADEDDVVSEDDSDAQDVVDASADTEDEDDAIADMSEADDADVEPSETADVAEPEATDAEEQAHAEAFESENESIAAFFAQAEDTVEENEAENIAEAEAVEPAAEVASDSIAAKLQRIRAVVSRSQEEAEKEEMFEDEHADEFAPSSDMDTIADAVTEAEPVAEEVLANAARDVDDSQAAQDDADAAETDAEDEGDDIGAILARFDAMPDEVVTEDDAAVSAEDEATDDLGHDTLAALMAADEDVETAEAADDNAGENLFDDQEDEVAAQDVKDADDMAEDAMDDVTEAAPRRARVIKVKRADIDAAIASGQLEEIAETNSETSESTLSDEEEAELLADLAQVEAEFPDAPSDTEISTETDLVDDDEDTEGVVFAEAVIEDRNINDVVEDTAASDTGEEVKVNDDDVSRLMAEAENQMDEPEGSRRRNAFAHLKAAVMAKKADAGIGKGDKEDEGAFRSDLASVVKPRRPAARGDGNARPEGARPAPLKLVAEQRVDLGDAPKGPVRPRRVASVEEVAVSADDAGSFAEYAADMGAHNLPDLLEAAASYLSFVEGRDQFSRPQLMTKVRQVERGEFSREDGLRSFGQLLRAGKIEKIKGGRFAVTGDIGYRPDEREAG